MSNGMILTNSGRNLLAKALTGKVLTFSKAAVGDGVLGTRSPQALTSLINKRKDLPIQSMSVANSVGTAEVVLEMTNKGMTQGFFIREYGLFAIDPDTRSEILYAYQYKDNAGYLEGDNGVDIISYTLSIVTVIDQAQNISAVINNSTQYVTSARMEQRVMDIYGSYEAPTGFWTYANGDMERIRPATIAQTRQALFGDADIKGMNGRIERLEDAVNQMSLSLEIIQDADTKYSHYMAEDFKGKSVLDTFSADVTSIVAGDDSLDVNPLDGMLPGSWYTISDGIFAEQAQVDTINIENGIQRVIFTDKIKNSFIKNNTRIFRTSSSTTYGLASGPDAITQQKWTPTLTWKGLAENASRIAYFETYTSTINTYNTYNPINATTSGYVNLDIQACRETHRNEGWIWSRPTSYLDLSDADKVNKIIVYGAEPTGTKRLFLLRIDGVWGKFLSDGTFRSYGNIGDADIREKIKNEGNTATELRNLTDISALAGKKIGMAIYLQTDDVYNAYPSAQLSFECSTILQQLRHTEYSPVYELGQDSQIISSSIDKTENVGSTINLYARITKPTGEVSEWDLLDNLYGTRANAIQFRGDYEVNAVNAASCTINEVSLLYVTGKSLISGLQNGEIISQTLDWYMPIHNCRFTVHHAPLRYSMMKAYVSFRDSVQFSEGETLGIGSGARKTYQLSHVNGIKYDSFKLYFDNVLQSGNYELNCEVGRVSCSAPSGVIVSCSYEYGWDKETWQEMPLTSRWKMDGYDKSEYRLSTNSNTKSAAAVKLQLITSTGHTDAEVLGTATGASTSFKLARRVRDGRLNLTANGVAIASKNWVLHDDPQYVSVAASAGQTIRASYDWISEPFEIYQFAVVFSD